MLTIVITVISLKQHLPELPAHSKCLLNEVIACYTTDVSFHLSPILKAHNCLFCQTEQIWYLGPALIFIFTSNISKVAFQKVKSSAFR